MKSQKGFTLIELVMVIVILGILSAVAVPKYENMKSDAKSAAARGVIANIRSAIAIKHSENALTTDTDSVPFPTIDELKATCSTSIFADRKMPTSPIDNCNSVTASSTDPIDVENECDNKVGGYLYNAATGEIRYNVEKADDLEPGEVDWNTI